MQFWIHEGMLPMSAQVLLKSVSISRPVPSSLAQTAAAHVLKDKTTGAKANQWLSGERLMERPTARCQLSVSVSSLTLNPPP